MCLRYEKIGPTASKPVDLITHDWIVLVGAAADGELAKLYRFTTNNPVAGWSSPASDDSSWLAGPASFGHALPGVQTSWTTGDIWLRQNFNFDGDAVKAAALIVFYHEETEIYLNGQRIWSHTGCSTGYEAFAVTEALQIALKKGANTFAVHRHQTAGGQMIDLALLYEAQASKLALNHSNQLRNSD